MLVEEAQLALHFHFVLPQSLFLQVYRSLGNQFVGE